MKVRFSKEVRFIPQYGGNADEAPADQLVAVLRPMDNNDLILTMDAFQEAGLEGKVDTEQVGLSQGKPILKIAPELLPRYVRVENLQNEAGDALTINDISSASSFLPLQIELFMQLVAVSNPSDLAIKNSKTPPV